jgi:hypothetical protein
MDEIMEITDKTLRRLLKVSHAEFNRVDAIRREIMLDKNAAKRRAMFYIDNGYLPPETPLPPLPEFPPECRGMICGGKSRRTGNPCQSRMLYTNGRCKWHGGLSTGPKTAAGKARSLGNLKRGPKL